MEKKLEKKEYKIENVNNFSLCLKIEMIILLYLIKYIILIFIIFYQLGILNIKSIKGLYPRVILT